MLSGASWSKGQLKATERDYKSLTSTYTHREEFMVIGLTVTPRPTEKSSPEDCVGVGRFLSFALENIKLNIFTNGMDEAVEFANFCLQERNKDVFCPFAMYNFLSPYNNQLSLVELSQGRGVNALNSKRSSSNKKYLNKKVMLAYCMACGISVEEGFDCDGLLDPSSRTWSEAMADRYGRERDMDAYAKDRGKDNAKPKGGGEKEGETTFYYTLASR